MGDPFDKTASSTSGSSGKQVMTGGPARSGAFIGVVAFQFRSHPRTAEANCKRQQRGRPGNPDHKFGFRH